jgi:Xaa-Pro aminopeptidase
VVTTNIEATRLGGEEKLGEQGWEFATSLWHTGKDLVGELTGGARLGADEAAPGARNLGGEVSRLRAGLTPAEGERFRSLGQMCAQAMELAARAVMPGQTEYQIAARLAYEAGNLGVQPIVNLIATDERIFNYRHPLPTDKKLARYAMLVLCGRKWGLVCSVTRLVHFGPLPDEVRRKAESTAQVDAAMIAATRPGRLLGDVLATAVAAYAGAGVPNEWNDHHQGGPAGYEPREWLAVPGMTDAVAVGQAYAWNPSIRGTKSEDTILVGEQGNEVLTEMSSWPSIRVDIGGETISRPAILEI